MADLSVELCGVKLKNPVIPASGTFGFGREFDEIYDISCLGGVATKGIALTPWGGNPVPRIAESRGVILNAVGLQNPGVEKFIAEDLAWLKGKTRVIANVVGRTLEEYEGVCARLDGLVDFLELNISCPNVRCGGLAFRHKTNHLSPCHFAPHPLLHHSAVLQLTEDTAHQPH